MGIEPITYGYSEVAPFSDYKERDFPGFNNPPHTTKKDWAKDTLEKSNNSIKAYICELILKIPSYFVSQSDYSNTWWAKGIFTLERATGTIGDMFRNQIYAHKDKTTNKMDDIIGAEISCGEDPNHSLAVINNQIQTKWRFLISALGLVSPVLANDLEWVGARAPDSCWWRNMGINLAYGTDFKKKLYNTLLKREGDKLTWDFIKSKFTDPIKNIRTSQGDFLKLCQNTDKLASSFLPVVNALNIFGDISRPIARRLGITGIPRNVIRILSVIDKPFFWITNLFRFYLPEKHIQKTKEDNTHGHLSYSDLLAASTIGDILDFGFLLFEDKIKDSSGNINHIAGILRRITSSLSDIYFSARRQRAHKDLI